MKLKSLLFVLVASIVFFLAFAQSTKFVASSKSNKYHYTWCRSAKRISTRNLIEFGSAADAQKAGYLPCKVCKPPSK